MCKIHIYAPSIKRHCRQSACNPNCAVPPGGGNNRGVTPSSDEHRGEQWPARAEGPASAALSLDSIDCRESPPSGF